jgi:hypothetical protein
MSILGLSLFSFMPMMQYFSMFSQSFLIAYFIIIMPILAFIIGFIILAIAATLHNVLAPRIGGIKLKFK